MFSLLWTTWNLILFACGPWSVRLCHFVNPSFWNDSFETAWHEVSSGQSEQNMTDEQTYMIIYFYFKKKVISNMKLEITLSQSQ